jgi:HPt (histidine-containing phosphotransfer) domain-containing protein
MHRNLIDYVLVLLIIMVLFQQTPIKEGWGVPSFISSAAHAVDSAAHSVAHAASNLNPIAKIEKLAKETIHNVENELMEPVKNLQNYMKTIKELFGEIGILIKKGITLLETSMSLLQSVAELMYLIIMKLQMCVSGSKEVYNGIKIQLNNVHNELIQLMTRTKQCSQIDKIITGSHETINLFNYVNKCIFNWGETIHNLVKITHTFKGILSNIQLFAIKSKHGNGKKWCTDNYKVGASFSYGKKCNQCFNFDGLLSQGTQELEDVEILIDASNELLAHARILKQKISKLKTQKIL